MNRRLRVLLAGRHYWPHGSIDSAAFLYHLSIGLHRCGVHVEVVSPRFAASWPEEFVLREIPVHRPAAAPRSDWSMGRYQRHLTGWLREHAASFDVLIADSMREESSAVIDAGRAAGRGTLVRFGGWGIRSDWSWWQSGRAARRCANVAKAADKVVSKCAASHRALLGEGYRPTQIQRVDQGFAPGSTRTSVARMRARAALATSNRDLGADAETPVIICCGRMVRDSGMMTLAKSARLLMTRYPDLRIWFIGDGPHRDAMHEYLRSEGIRRSIAMPGSFCDMDDLFAAADVFVQADDDGLEWMLGNAVSQELPVVCIDNESARNVIMGPNPQSQVSLDAASLVSWYSADAPKSLRSALQQVLEDRESHQQRAASLRKVLVRSRPQSELFQSYLQLIRQIAAKQTDREQNANPGRSQPPSGDSSVEAAS